jgi:hypothetical protein
MWQHSWRTRRRRTSSCSRSFPKSSAHHCRSTPRAIDHLASSAGLSERERIALLRPHAVNPAVLHARVFGAAPLTRETVIASFVDGARVRADSLADLAGAIGGAGLGAEVMKLLVADPPPVDAGRPDAIALLQRTYRAQERASLLIAAALDAQE